MQYKVPQNVDIEDKVIAGLTLRQFMFLIVAGGIDLLLNYVFTEQSGLRFLFMPCAIAIGGLGVALAFLKINDRPFELFLMSAGKSVVTPNRRMWEKEVNIDKDEHIPVKKEEKAPKKQSLNEIKSNLERLALVVDSGGAHEMDSDDNRISNLRQRPVDEPQKIEDILEATEKPSERLTKFFDKAVKEVASTKKEPTISAVASKQTTPQDYKYENIELANEKALEEILDKAEADQKKKEDQLKAATIKKFERT